MNKICSGFSLMETVIAVSILALMASFVASAVPHEYAVTSETQEVIKASDLAQKYIEDVKYQLKDITNFDNVEEGSIPPVSITSEVTANGYYTVVTSVENVGRTDRDDFLKEITVSYLKKNNSKLLVKLSTVIVRPQYKL